MARNAAFRHDGALGVRASYPIGIGSLRVDAREALPRRRAITCSGPGQIVNAIVSEMRSSRRS